MPKFNLKTLKKDEIFNYYETTVNELWSEKKVPILFHISNIFDDVENKKQIKKFIQEKSDSIENALQWIETSKEIIGKAIIKDNFLKKIKLDMLFDSPIYPDFKINKRKGFLSILEDWIKSNGIKREFQGQEFYITSWESKVDFPITQQNFINSLFIEGIEFEFNENYLDIHFKIEFFPDYFNGLKLLIFIQADQEGTHQLKQISLIDDETDDKDDFFDEYNDKDDDLEDPFSPTFFNNMMNNCVEVENVVKDFIEALNSHNIKRISVLMDKNFLYINQIDDSKNKDSTKKLFDTHFKLFPDFNIKIVELGMGNENTVFVHGTMSGTYKNIKTEDNRYFWTLPVVFKALVFNKKIKTWQVFSDTKTFTDIIALGEKESSKTLKLFS